MKVGDNFVADHEPLTRRPSIDSPLWSDLSSSSLSPPSQSFSELKDIHYVPYVMPDSSLCSFLCFIPQSITHSLRNMAQFFGWGFVCSVVIVYGFQQGLGNSWLFQARDYYFKDIAKIEPAEAQSLIAISMTPWNLKPIYGMLSDSIPICGYHRIPYITLAGLLGCLCFGLLSSMTFTPIMAVLLLIGVNISVASPDVMVDGLIAEKSREYPPFATDLQSLCWGCMSLFAISGYLTSGYMITEYGSITMFKLLIISSVVIVITGIMNWFGEINKQTQSQLKLHDLSLSSTGSNSQNGQNLSPSPTTTTCLCGVITVDKSFVENHTNLFFIGTFIPFLAIFLSTIILLFTQWEIRLITILLVWIIVIISFYGTAYTSGLPAVANAGLFIFLSNSLTPDIETAMFYWYTNSPDGPQFTPQFVGYISGIAFGAMFVGILIYNRYLSSWKYRSIFATTMFFLALMGLIDVILVKRWNLEVGIPDEIMILGDSALSPMARRFYIMPLFILAAKVCPNGAEATVFSLLTALGNFGSSISVYFGSLVLYYFDITDGNYSNLITVILIRCGCRLLPILLIPFLIPDDSPYPSESSSETTPLSTPKYDLERHEASSTLGDDGRGGGSFRTERGKEEKNRGNGRNEGNGGGILKKIQELGVAATSRKKEDYTGLENESSEHSLMSSSATPFRVSNSLAFDSEDEDYDGIMLPVLSTPPKNPFDSSREKLKKHVDLLVVSTTQSPLK